MLVSLDTPFDVAELLLENACPWGSLVAGFVRSWDTVALSLVSFSRTNYCPGSHVIYLTACDRLIMWFGCDIQP